MSVMVEAVKDSDIEAAALIDDLDAAVLSLMEIAGIDDGGVAAHCFSGFEWETADAHERVTQLHHWLRTERRYAEEDNQ